MIEISHSQLLEFFLCPDIHCQFLVAVMAPDSSVAGGVASVVLYFLVPHQIHAAVGLFFKHGFHKMI